jgi:epoxyqueuosine reductase
LLIAYAQFPTRFTFLHRGIKKSFRVPPTYLHGLEEDRKHPEPICEFCSRDEQHLVRAAIPSDRFLLHAENYLTWWNEKTPSQEFPGWIKPEWHNSLIGCMQCQAVCPENREFIYTENEGGFFDEAETGTLLQAQSLDDLPGWLVDKLD